MGLMRVSMGFMRVSMRVTEVRRRKFKTHTKGNTVIKHNWVDRVIVSVFQCQNTRTTYVCIATLHTVVYSPLSHVITLRTWEACCFPVLNKEVAPVTVVVMLYGDIRPTLIPYHPLSPSSSRLSPHIPLHTSEKWNDAIVVYRSSVTPKACGQV